MRSDLIARGSGRVVILLPEAHAGVSREPQQSRYAVSLCLTLRHKFCKSGPANAMV